MKNVPKNFNDPIILILYRWVCYTILREGLSPLSATLVACQESIKWFRWTSPLALRPAKSWSCYRTCSFFCFFLSSVFHLLTLCIIPYRTPYVNVIHKEKHPSFDECSVGWRPLCLRSPMLNTRRICDEPPVCAFGFRLHYNILKTEKQEKTEKLILLS